MCAATVKSSLLWLLGVVVLLASLDALAQRTYSVSIETKPPGATIYLDDQTKGPIGYTPLKTKLEEGTYTLILELGGYEIHREILVVNSKLHKQVLSYTLTKKTISLSIKGTRGAQLYIDGVANGKVPSTAVGLAPGKHLIEVKKEGYAPFSQWVDLQQSSQEIDATLRPIWTVLDSAAIKVFVPELDPAEVFLDGVKKGESPITLDHLSPGSYLVRVQKADLAPFEQEIVVTNEQVVVLRVDLAKGKSATAAYKWVNATPLLQPSPLLAPVEPDSVAAPQKEYPSSVHWLTQGACCSFFPRASSATLFGLWGDAAAGLVIAVGKDGTIERSENNGALWRTSNSQTTQTLRAVWGSAPNDIYAVGEGGTIVRSTDKGASWSPLASGVSGALYGLWGSSASNLYAVGEGGLILRSTNQGKTWQREESESFESLYGIFGRSSSEIYAVGEYGKILRKDGSQWRSITSGTTQNLHAIWGTKGGALLAVGHDGTILRSTDGENWYQAKSNTNAALYAVWGTSSGVLYAAGHVVLKSIDDGRTWSEVTANIALRALWGPDAGSLLLVGF